MPIRITVMKRIENNGRQVGTVLFQDLFHFLPHAGDILQLKNIPSHANPTPYEILKVIIRNTDVVLEVKEYNNPENPLVTELPSV